MHIFAHQHSNRSRKTHTHKRRMPKLPWFNGFLSISFSKCMHLSYLLNKYWIKYLCTICLWQCTTWAIDANVDAFSVSIIALNRFNTHTHTIYRLHSIFSTFTHELFTMWQRKARAKKHSHHTNRHISQLKLISVRVLLHTCHQISLNNVQYWIGVILCENIFGVELVFFLVRLVFCWHRLVKVKMKRKTKINAKRNKMFIIV